MTARPADRSTVAVARDLADLADLAEWAFARRAAAIDCEDALRRAAELLPRATHHSSWDSFVAELEAAAETVQRAREEWSLP